MKVPHFLRSVHLAEKLIAGGHYLMTSLVRGGRSTVVKDAVEKLREMGGKVLPINLRTASDNINPIGAFLDHFTAQFSTLIPQEGLSEGLQNALSLYIQRIQQFTHFCATNGIPLTPLSPEITGKDLAEIRALQEGYHVDFFQILARNPSFTEKLQTSFVERGGEIPSYIPAEAIAGFLADEHPLARQFAKLQLEIDRCRGDAIWGLSNNGILETVDGFREEMEIEDLYVFISSLHVLLDHQEAHRGDLEKLLGNLQNNTFPKLHVSCDTGLMASHWDEIAPYFPEENRLILSPLEISEYQDLLSEIPPELLEKIQRITGGRVVELKILISALERIDEESIDGAGDEVLAQLLQPFSGNAGAKKGGESYEGLLSFIRKPEFYSSPEQRELFLQIVASSSPVQIYANQRESLSLFFPLGLLEEVDGKVRIRGRVLKAILKRNLEG